MAQKDVNEEIFQRLTMIEAKTAEPEIFSVANWVPEAFHDGSIGGIVVDEGLARESPCRRIALGDSSYLMYSKGVVGALSREQEPLYCERIEDMSLPPEVVERQRKLRDAALVCQTLVKDLEGHERLEPFMQCLSAQAKEQGIDL